MFYMIPPTKFRTHHLTLLFVLRHFFNINYEIISSLFELTVKRELDIFWPEARKVDSSKIEKKKKKKYISYKLFSEDALCVHNE